MDGVNDYGTTVVAFNSYALYAETGCKIKCILVMILKASRKNGFIVVMMRVAAREAVRGTGDDQFICDEIMRSALNAGSIIPIQTTKSMSDQ